MSCVVNGASQPDTPDVWLRMCRTSMCSLPFSANSGQYLATGEYGSSWPRSASIRAARLVTVLVVDHTLVIVFSVHGRPRPGSHQPPQMSTTVRPSTSTAMLAPVSLPESSCAASVSRTGPNLASHVPCTSTIGGQPFLIERPDSASSSSPIRTVGEINNGPFAALSHARQRDARREAAGRKFGCRARPGLAASGGQARAGHAGRAEGGTSMCAPVSQFAMPSVTASLRSTTRARPCLPPPQAAF